MEASQRIQAINLLILEYENQTICPAKPQTQTEQSGGESDRAHHIPSHLCREEPAGHEGERTRSQAESALPSDSHAPQDSRPFAGHTALAPRPCGNEEQPQSDRPPCKQHQWMRWLGNGCPALHCFGD